MVILVRAQEGKKRGVSKTCIFLNNTYIIIYRILVGRWTVKVIVMRCPMRIRNKLLDNVEIIILIIKWQINCVHGLVFCCTMYEH